MSTVPQPGPVDQLVEVADAVAELGRQIGGALRRAIVVEAGEPQAHLRRPLDVPGQLNAQLVHAADRIASAC